MNQNAVSSESSNNGIEFAKWIISNATGGFGPLSSAENLAQEYMLDKSYPDNDARVDSLIKWETGKNFSSGFLTGVGGVISLPAQLTASFASFAAGYCLQARMVTAIAIIYGHNPNDDRIKTVVLLCLCGQSATDILKIAGVKYTEELCRQLIEKLSEETCKKIAELVGEKLISKGTKEALAALIPLVGGVVRGTFDAVSCQACGRTAKAFFSNKTQ